MLNKKHCQVVTNSKTYVAVEKGHASVEMPARQQRSKCNLQGDAAVFKHGIQKKAL